MRTHRLIVNLCAVVLLLIISLAGLGVAQMISVARTNATLSSLFGDELTRLLALRSLTADLFQVNRLCLSTLIVLSDAEAPPGEEIAGSMRRSAALFENQAKILENLRVSNLSSSATFQELEIKIAAYGSDVGRFFEIAQGGDVEAARAFRLTRLRPAIDALNALLGEVSQEMGTSLQARTETLSDDASRRGVASLLFSGWPFLVILITIIWLATVLFRYLASVDETSELPVS